MTRITFSHNSLARTMGRKKGNTMSEERRGKPDMGEHWMSQPEFERL